MGIGKKVVFFMKCLVKLNGCLNLPRLPVAHGIRDSLTQLKPKVMGCFWRNLNASATWLTCNDRVLR